MRPALRVLAGAAAMAASIGVVAVVSPAGADVDRSQLAEVRAATAKYHNLDLATDPDIGDYELLDAPCFEGPSGGQGIHYVHAFDNVIEADNPEALVYEVTDQGPRLVAVEYIAVGAGADSLSVLGQPLHNLPGTPLWILHAWVWKHNPDGMFADYNPKVGPCP